MAQLRGKVCALAFINAGSAWSQQRLNDLAHLRARHGDRLNVVAVHVPRFDNERDARRVAKRLSRQKLEFPIAHDPDWTLWQHYGIEAWPTVVRSEEHTSELQSLMRISYAVFCLKNKKRHKQSHHHRSSRIM